VSERGRRLPAGKFCFGCRVGLLGVCVLAGESLSLIISDEPACCIFIISWHSKWAGWVYTCDYSIEHMGTIDGWQGAR
ncbi:uncharacterized protein METZ01_LOCUS131676, partial [marine metagenome]